MGQVEVVGRAVLALGAVLFVMWCLGRAVRRSRRHSDEVLEVVGRKHLSKGVSLAVVRVGGRTVLIGVTDGQVSLLGDVDVAAGTDVAPAAPAVVAAPAAAPVVPAAAPIPRPLRAVQPATVPAVRARHGAAPDATPKPAGPLAGSALSPATWKQSVDALRDLTVRSRVG